MPTSRKIALLLMCCTFLARPICIQDAFSANKKDRDIKTQISQQHDLVKRKLIFNDITIETITVKPTGWPIYKVIVSRKNQVIYQDESILVDPFPQKINYNTLLPGCKTVLVTTYSGGARCCFTTMLLMLYPNGLILKKFFSPIEGFVKFADLNNDGRKEILVLDYIHPESCALSPGSYAVVIMVYVYDRKKIRPAIPGEFKNFYRKLLRTHGKYIIPKNMDIGSTTSPTTSAYYSLMSGQTEIEAKKYLEQINDPYCTDSADSIVANLKKIIWDNLHVGR